MQFGLSTEQTLLQDSLNRFLTDKVPLDQVRKVAKGDQDQAAIWQGLVDLGISGLLIPESLGGVGLGMMEAAIVAECLGSHVTPSPFISSSVMAVKALVAAGGQDELLAKIAAGTGRCGIAFTEAYAARDGAGITNDGNRLSGRAMFAMDAKASHYLLADVDKNLYLVSADAITIKPLTTIDRTRDTCELILENAQAELISSDPAVYARALDAGRIMLAADSLGAGQNMLDQSVVYAHQREQFDRVIASFQAVKHMCAEMAAQLEPCRAMVWYAAHAFDHLPDEARLICCHNKAHVSEVGKFVAKTATEVHGGMGFTDLVGLHYWFKRIGFNRQLLGSPEALREEAARLQKLAA